ncbi:aminoacyl-histidine dipeptidase [Polaribacter aestuariivivens]|uniref:Cytosol non-specific dipeptidase n=1 Tax=Polaribacter aestuariivivens TaxID=2304626 RepID=A0A5S3NF96_9FLAO|nr:aminoacyl-histidine dipeptidase [Polaribacter aestuariivivens]TMM31966.1 aminoacyl-histidine dipeptidase [Polaribacter aestuariivivens]
MSKEVRNLAPKEVWNMFADLNAVPRPSKKEERIIQFMVNFGKQLNLETSVDKVGNVIIKKPATNGFENRKTIVLQSHLDMVHQKNNDTVFDFEKEGIKMRVEGDWVKANGTTLGADNGLGVAAIMAVLASNTIQHPNLEALFTIDEETGMTGAKGLEGGILNGDILLNLDTEEDDEIGMGCAGGVDITATKSYSEETIPQNFIAYKLEVKGLNGGHSGMDIIKGLGNANKLMNRLHYSVINAIQICEIDGGSLRNAIPRESTSIIVTDKNNDKFVESSLLLEIDKIKKEFKTLEPNLEINFSSTEVPETSLSKETSKSLIKSIYAAVNGVYRMSPDIDGLVETSNNIARVIVKNGAIKVGCLTRSSSESNKFDLANSLKSAFELAGFEVTFSGEYPGWQPNINSEILEIVANLYENLHGEKANVAACHAGLECGILGQNYPEMDMVSFGPTIRGAHSPDERASISSTQKFWKFLIEILKNTPKK